MILAVVLIGLCVRISVRDEVPYLATIYYSTPLSLLFFGSVTAWLLLRKQCSAVTRYTLTALTIGCAVAFGMLHYHTPMPTDSAQSAAAIDVIEGNENRSRSAMRIAFWNVARGRFGWDAVFEAIEDFDADVIGLVECTEPWGKLTDRLQTDFPDYEVARFDHGMVILSRFPIVSFENRECKVANINSLKPIAYFGLAHLRMGAHSLPVIIADIDSDPLYFRKRPIESLLSIANEFQNQPTVILGDFNTPTDSVFVAGLRTDYANAFEQAGHGIDCTWPVPFPVMAIDQMWVSRHWKLRTTRLGWSWLSDHRPIISDVLLPK